MFYVTILIVKEYVYFPKNYGLHSFIDSLQKLY
jgi:hypothetical protein